MNKFLKYGQYLLVLCCIIIFFYIIRDFNSEKLKSIVGNINYLWIALTILIAVCISLIKVFRIKIISEQFNNPVSFSVAYKAQIIGILLAFLTPGRVGEVSKVFFLADKNKEKYPKATGIMIFEVILDFICISIISLLFFGLIMKSLILSLFTVLLLGFAIGMIFFIIKGNKIIEKFPDNIKDFFRYMLNNKVNIFYKWYLSIPLSAAAWILDGFYQYLILKSVSVDSNPFILTGVSAISSIISVISILPLGFGVNDLSSLFLYKKFIGLKTEYVLFLVNATRLFWVITLGIMALPYMKIIFNGEWKKTNSKEEI